MHIKHAIAATLRNFSLAESKYAHRFGDGLTDMRGRLRTRVRRAVACGGRPLEFASDALTGSALHIFGAPGRISHGK